MNREEISDLKSTVDLVLNNPWPENVFSRKKIMCSFFFGPVWLEFTGIELRVHYFQHLWDISFFHWSNISFDIEWFSIWKSVLRLELLESHPSLNCISDIEEFLAIKEPIHMRYSKRWWRMTVIGGINWLVYAIHPLSSWKLLDQNRSKSLPSQSFMHSHKTNFWHIYNIVKDFYLSWICHYCRHDFVLVIALNAQMEISNSIWLEESPLELLFCISQSESTRLVLNIVRVNKGSEILEILVVIQVNIGPVETCW